MRDPVERMLLFVEDQKDQARFVCAKSVWSRKIPALVRGLEVVVEVFQSGLDESFPGAAVSILADPKRDLFPLVVAFSSRPAAPPGILPFGPVQADKETGASALFRCEADGQVYGFRYPFHSARKSLPPERFVVLGDPTTIQPEQVGNAVADFLEWAAVGAGCGRRKLRFGARDGIPYGTGQQVKLAILAA